MQLFPEEKEICSIKSVTLTTHRLWRESKRSDHKALKVIMLEDVCSCSLEYEAKPMWRWLAITAGAMGLLAAISNPREFGGSGIIGGLVLGVVFYLVYLGSKTQYMELSSAAARITIDLPGDDVLPAKQFVEATIAAKNNRYLTLRPGERMAQGTEL